MAILNGQQIKIEHLSIDGVGELLRDAFMRSEPQEAQLKLTDREQSRIALEELQPPKGFVFPDDSLGEILGISVQRAFARHAEASALNFSYHNRTFVLDGKAYPA